MTIHWKAVEHHFIVVLFVFQFYPVCSFRKFINFGLGTVRSERLNRIEQINNMVRALFCTQETARARKKRLFLFTNLFSN